MTVIPLEDGPAVLKNIMLELCVTQMAEAEWHPRKKKKNLLFENELL